MASEIARYAQGTSVILEHSQSFHGLAFHYLKSPCRPVTLLRGREKLVPLSRGGENFNRSMYSNRVEGGMATGRLQHHSPCLWNGSTTHALPFSISKSRENAFVEVAWCYMRPGFRVLQRRHFFFVSRNEFSTDVPRNASRYSQTKQCKVNLPPLCLSSHWSRYNLRRSKIREMKGKLMLRCASEALSCRDKSVCDVSLMLPPHPSYACQ